MKITMHLLALGLACAAPLAHATHDGVSGWAGLVCYSDGSGRTVIDYQSINACNVRVADAAANPPTGASVTSITYCALRGTGTALPWCLRRNDDLFSVEIENGDIRPALDFKQRLDDLRKRYLIDEYERQLQELHRGR
ncbi:hypothetical protein [Dokdonella koreensis]|uniref:Secreted protein n=1 Tax=Dokdonella koreensis DS-123 TaxID=1300342 RepID=A0A160DTX1_9GAMM|nr:hypothetical protein [Dokdonella koreensis]ANB17849.1 Hypothetical protein I596_1826 [Dokdonella koreensis DS-123]